MDSYHTNQDDGKPNQCVLCFNPSKGDGFRDTNSVNLSKLYKLCCKYLHSALTAENSKKNQFNDIKNEKILPFCRDCFRSAVQLSELREKLILFEKNVSELILLFSFGILHRREKAGISEENEETSSNYLSLNVSLFPECETWKLPKGYHHPPSPFSRSKDNNNVTGENGLLDEFEFDLRPEITTNQIQVVDINDDELGSMKIEILQNEEIDLLDRTTEKAPENSESQNIMTDFCSSTQISDQKHSKTLTETEKLDSSFKTPVVILERLKYKSNGNIISKPRDDSIPSQIFNFEPIKVDADSDNLELERSQSAGPSHLTIDNKNISERIEHSDTSQIFEVVPTEDNYLQAKNLQFQSNMSLSSNTISPDWTFSLNNPLTDTETLKRNRLRVANQKTKIIVSNSLLELKKRKYKSQKASSKISVGCLLCGKLYASRDTLSVHMKFFHGKEKVHRIKCAECDKEFLRRGDYTRHILIHTGFKQFKCSFCNRKFVLKKCLREHIRRHTGERIPCPVCKKEFIYRASLFTHLKKHNIEEPYKCELCAYSCKYPRMLKIHHASIHVVKFNFKCRECDEQFTTFESAVQHYKHVHFALDFSDDCIIKTEEC